MSCAAVAWRTSGSGCGSSACNNTSAISQATSRHRDLCVGCHFAPFVAEDRSRRRFEAQRARIFRPFSKTIDPFVCKSVLFRTDFYETRRKSWALRLKNTVISADGDCAQTARAFPSVLKDVSTLAQVLLRADVCKTTRRVNMCVAVAWRTSGSGCGSSACAPQHNNAQLASKALSAV